MGIEGFIPFESATIGHVFYPDYFEYYRDIPVSFEMRANDSPAFSDSQQKPYLEVSHEFDSPVSVDFAYEAKEGYKDVAMNVTYVGK